MTMNRLFRHTITSTLRLALLFGAIMLVNTQTQIKAQTAGLPDAFETMDPASIIGDGNYYYIQFYNGSDRSFLSDQGSGNDLRSKDYVLFRSSAQGSPGGPLFACPRALRDGQACPSVSCLGPAAWLFFPFSGCL